MLLGLWRKFPEGSRPSVSRAFAAHVRKVHKKTEPQQTAKPASKVASAAAGLKGGEILGAG